MATTTATASAPPPAPTSVSDITPAYLQAVVALVQQARVDDVGPRMAGAKSTPQPTQPAPPPPEKVAFTKANTRVIDITFSKTGNTYRAAVSALPNLHGLGGSLETQWNGNNAGTRGGLSYTTPLGSKLSLTAQGNFASGYDKSNPAGEIISLGASGGLQLRYFPNRENILSLSVQGAARYTSMPTVNAVKAPQGIPAGEDLTTFLNNAYTQIVTSLFDIYARENTSGPNAANLSVPLSAWIEPGSIQQGFGKGVPDLLGAAEDEADDVAEYLIVSGNHAQPLTGDIAAALAAWRTQLEQTAGAASGAASPTAVSAPQPPNHALGLTLYGSAAWTLNYPLADTGRWQRVSFLGGLSLDAQTSSSQAGDRGPLPLDTRPGPHLGGHAQLGVGVTLPAEVEGASFEVRGLVEGSDGAAKAPGVPVTLDRPSVTATLGLRINLEKK